MKTDSTTNFVADTFRQATENFTKAVQTGIQLQQETAKFWTDMLTKQAETARSQFEKVSAEAVPAQKRAVETFQKMFDEQSRSAMELLRKSFEVGQARDGGQACDRLSTIWKDSFEAMRSSADTLTRAQHEMIESWASLAKNGNGSHATATR